VKREGRKYREENKMFAKFLQKVPLIFTLARRDFQEKYLGSALNIWWSFIWPIVNILIYTIIFSKVMGAKLKGVPSHFSYGLYLASGLLPWTTFSNTIFRVTTSFVDKSFIISKTPIPLLSLPLAIVLSESFTFFISYFVFSLFLLIFHIYPSSESLFLFFVFFFQQLFAIAIGLILAIFNVFLRDIREITSIVLQLWFWFTPIVYPFEILPSLVKKLMILNPAYAFIHCYQNLLVLHLSPNWVLVIFYTVIAFFLFFLATKFLARLEKDLRDLL